MWSRVWPLCRVLLPTLLLSFCFITNKALINYSVNVNSYNEIHDCYEIYIGYISKCDLGSINPALLKDDDSHKKENDHLQYQLKRK